ncbi:MAG: segregation/condensation protein A [Myxococcota bacterium]
MEATVEPAWTVHTEVFEGPLDLLLYLVQRDGIDLKRLQVARIADAYLEFLDHMRDMNLSLAGEYLVMAATLVHLKSLELLPRLPTPVDEDAPDPREEFARQLQSYARYREAADQLERRPWLGRDQFTRAEPESGEGELDAGLDAFGLLELYRELLAASEAPEPEVTFAHEVRLDLGTAAMALLDSLRAHGGHGELTALLSSLPNRAQRVVTFIGVLEMLRLGWIALEQRFHLAPIELSVVVPPEVSDPRALSGWVEEAEAG